ncbi:MAG: phytoene/squalene synthase family protein [Planctomycetales bacterium]|nr:phytoene/squalene synthase family protein [Planctomycetales bacterium]
MPVRLTSTQSLALSYEACRVLTRRTAHNFRFSFLTLPREMRSSMNALYAFNRITDDIGDDEIRLLDDRQKHLTAWRAAVRTALSSEVLPSTLSASDQLLDVHRYLPAISDTAARYRIPHEYLFAVIDGVQTDMQPVRMETFQDLERYCYQVAGAVGLCCIHIWGFREDPQVRQLSIDCGLAFQLTNILRDLTEDSRRGRIYLPREDFTQFQYRPEDLCRGVYDQHFRDLMRFETARAWSYYASGEGLLRYLDRPGKSILRAMLDIYGGLLRTIERCDFNVLSQRISLPTWKKLWIAGRATVQSHFGRIR